MDPLTKAGVVIGFGLGGRIDGIFFHQILGWHHLVCSTATCQVDTVAALKAQNTADGFFHLAAWRITIFGIGWLFQASRNAGFANHTWHQLVGAALSGWGIFNFVEGLIDHHLLEIHHVLPRSRYEFIYDLLFLCSGIVLMIVGASLVRRSGKKAPRVDIKT